MTEADIERLVAERSLERRDFDDAAVAGFWSKAMTSLKDAHSTNLSAEGKLQLAYTAGLQATFAVLAAAGLRVKSSASHYKAFYAMQRLGDDALRVFATRMDEVRQVRHQSVYEPIEHEAEAAARAADTLATLDTTLPDVKSWLLQRRPQLRTALAS